MPVGNNKTVLWYSVNNGKIRHRAGEDESFFDYIEGNLISIDKHTDKWAGKPVPKYQFKFEPDDHSYTEILSMGENSSALRGVLASLTTIPEKAIRQVRFRPYINAKNFDGDEVEFTNVDVSYRASSGQPWQRLIEDESTQGMYKKIFRLMPQDENERVEYLRRMAESIKHRLNHPSDIPARRTKVDESTGEIIDHSEPARDLYNKPEKHRPVPQEIYDDIPDNDDDLPF